MKRKPKKYRKTESLNDKIFKEEHMLSGEAEASYLMRHPKAFREKNRKTAPIIVESELGNHYLHCGKCHTSLDSLRKKIMLMVLTKPAKRKPLRCPGCKILLNFKRLGISSRIVAVK